MGHIQIIYGEREQFIYIHKDNPLFVGENPDASYSAVLKGAGLEDNHARIENINNQIFITDLSVNSQIVYNNQLLVKNNPTFLDAGTQVKLGSDGVSIIIPNINYVTELPESAPKLIDLVSQLEGKDIIKIGRNVNNDLVIADTIVAPFHAEFYKKQDAVYVRDLGSTNGTFIGGEKIKGERKLDSNEVCFIGLTALTIGKTNIEFKPNVAITALNISKVFEKGNIGLQPMNTSINTGEFVALMGPSGCGKSTLLKALSGDNPATGGKVFLFGLDLIEHFKLLKKKIGYVPQEDIIHRELTVYETLYYAAKLRLDEATPEIEIKNRINEVLTSLNINNDKIIKNRVNSLSGGQRKRVSIAVELLNKPSILFLDEPTSPLDPETIDEFLKCIQQLCQNGTTVVMVTHKPEDLIYADKLIFMGTAGHHVFEGKSKDILTHFDKENLVQIYSLLSKSSETKKWYKKWYANAVEPEITSRNNFKVDRDSNFIYQLKWLIKRCYAVKVGNKSNLILQFIQPVIIALLINLVFKNLIQDGRIKAGAIFMMNIATIWFGVSTAGKEIIGELAIYKRERMFNLKIGPYLISKVVVLGLIGVIQTLLITSIIKINFKEQIPLFLDVWIFLTFIHLSSTLLGLFISAAAKSTESVMTIIPIALLPQNILAGIVAPIEDKVTEIASIFTFGRWGTEALARIQDNYKTAEFTEQLINKNLYYKDSFTWFNSFTGNLTIMCIIDFALILLLIWSLKRKDAIQF